MDKFKKIYCRGVYKHKTIGVVVYDFDNEKFFFYHENIQDMMTFSKLDKSERKIFIQAFALYKTLQHLEKYEISNSKVYHLLNDEQFSNYSVEQIRIVKDKLKKMSLLRFNIKLFHAGEPKTKNITRIMFREKTCTLCNQSKYVMEFSFGPNKPKSYCTTCLNKRKKNNEYLLLAKDGKVKSLVSILQLQLFSENENYRIDHDRRCIHTVHEVYKTNESQLKKLKDEFSLPKKIALCGKNGLVIDYISKKSAANLLVANKGKKKNTNVLRLFHNATEDERLAWLNIQPQKPRAFYTMKLYDTSGKAFYISNSVVKRLNDGGMVVNGFLRSPHLKYSYDSFKEEFFSRHDTICVYCGKFGDTIDHVNPKSNGGLTTFRNCVVACKECNNLKANLTLEEFSELISNKK
jgi:hypothetical protein